MTPSRWPIEKKDRLRGLAARGFAASEIAAAMNETTLVIVRKCKDLGIDFVRFTAAEQAEHQEIMRRRWRGKHKKKRARAKMAADFVAPVVRPGTSRTSAVYRQKLPPAPPMTRSQMEAELRQAVLNTGGRI